MDADKTLRFLIFTDLHYYEGYNLGSVADLKPIFSRAASEKVDFVVQGGDFTNDFPGSPELFQAFLNNEENLSVFSVLGNHDLEARGSDLSNAVAVLTNRPRKLVWGNRDGCSNGSIAHYYFDQGPFRAIFTDTNYYFSPEKKQWVHTLDDSAADPHTVHSLGPDQIAWLEAVLKDAAMQDKKCIVFSHVSLNPTRSMHTPDAPSVRELFRKINAQKKGTVLMAVNGHTHSDRLPMLIDGVVYLEVNSTRNGYWIPGSPHHYAPDHRCKVQRFDHTGQLSSEDCICLRDLKEGNSTWFFDRPLSAVVTVHSNGDVIIDGMEAKWLYDIAPEDVPDFIVPRISGGTFHCF